MEHFSFAFALFLCFLLHYLTKIKNLTPLAMNEQLISIDQLNHFTAIVLDSCIRVHKEMGPGLLESVYHHCLLKELSYRQVRVESKVPIPLMYRGEDLNKDYVIDILVEGEIIVELKSIEGLLAVHEAQVISYLKLTKKKIGLLVNFNVTLMKHGFRRFVN
jgi:GxxExxY protein